MEANELRIGNLVKTNQGVFKVTQISQNEIDICPFLSNEPFSIFINNAIPIPLTEEWLLKFGFENKYGCFLLSTKRGTIQIEEDLAEISSVITHIGFMAPCKHVHQLQNLFFALTGEELKLIY